MPAQYRRMVSPSSLACTPHAHARGRRPGNTNEREQKGRAAGTGASDAVAAVRSCNSCGTVLHIVRYHRLPYDDHASSPFPLPPCLPPPSPSLLPSLWSAREGALHAAKRELGRDANTVWHGGREMLAPSTSANRSLGARLHCMTRGRGQVCFPPRRLSPCLACTGCGGVVAGPESVVLLFPPGGVMVTVTAMCASEGATARVIG